MPCFNWHKVQKCPFFGVKVEVKNVRKSVKWVTCCLDATSAILLNFPEISSPANLAASFTWNLIANAQIKLDAICEELDLILYNHAIAAMLSHQIATDANFSARLLTAISSTSQCSITPASSSSEMEMVPVGLASMTSLSQIELGHSRNQTMGCRSLPLPNQTPPTPQPEALTIPW